jgi:HPt (histidine-containing phosphotransfer) domain-containing protein
LNGHAPELSGPEEPAGADSAARLLDDPGIGAAERERLSAMFAASLRKELGRIEQGLLQQDRPLLIEASHKLAGAAGVFGFEQISQAAHEIEKQTRAGAAVRADDDAVSRLMSLCRQWEAAS